MSVAILADAHLGGPDGDAALFLAQLRALPEQGCTHLVLLGDIFHVWVGFPQFETDEVTAVIAELRRLRAGGLRIEYVEGNRDFFVGGSRYADAFDRYGLEVPFDAGGRRGLAVHGDGLNDRDHSYRFWRWLSKSPPIRLLVAALPGMLARRFVHGTERRLARTNFKHRRALPEAAIRAYAEKRLAEGYDLLVLGHFHEDHKWAVRGGEVRLLEAWFSSLRVEWFR